MYRLDVNDGFEADFSVKTDGAVDTVTVRAKKSGEPARLWLTLTFEISSDGAHNSWAPCQYNDRAVRPSWWTPHESKSYSSVPIISTLGHNDENILTISASDTVTRIYMKSGVNSVTSLLVNSICFAPDVKLSEYTAEVRVDRRNMPFYEAIADAVRWQESFESCAHGNIPEEARLPMYSTWYSFHQNLTPEAVADECRYFKKLGCDTVIVDHGWEMEGARGGFATSGDWAPYKGKVPDMKAFVDLVHSCGMKMILWYSLPFVGIDSENFKRFEGKFLGNGNTDKTRVLDIRYPEIREHLISTLKNAVLDWGLDGFKLDFIDYLLIGGEKREGMDHESVCEAAVRLLDDLKVELTAINPDILIEYRQNYFGARMRTLGTMMRSSDCQCDSYTNRMNILAIRFVCGETPVHSDMMMWSMDSTAEIAAFQFTETLFSVPQVSVRHNELPESHKKMVAFMLDFWVRHRKTLLDGKLFCKNFSAGFSYVSASLDNEQVGAVYSGKLAYLENPTDRIVIVNATTEDRILLESRFGGRYAYTVTNCMGESVSDGEVDLAENYSRIMMPVNGIVTMNKIG